MREKLIKIISEYYLISSEQLLDLKTREGAVCEARVMLFYCTYVFYIKSAEKIAEMYNRKSATSVRRAISDAVYFLKIEEDAFCNNLKEITKLIKS